MWLLMGIYEIYEHFRQSDLLRNYTHPSQIEGINNDTASLALMLGITFLS